MRCQARLGLPCLFSYLVNRTVEDRLGITCELLQNLQRIEIFAATHWEVLRAFSSACLPWSRPGPFCLGARAQARLCSQSADQQAAWLRPSVAPIARRAGEALAQVLRPWLHLPDGR